MTSKPPAREGTWEGVPVGALESRWGVPRLEVHPELPSTNDRARDLATSGAPPFTVVLADAQTAGRGRHGRPWHSPREGGLWMSVLVRSGEGAAARRLLPLLVGLAAARAVERTAPGVRVGLKWPNDLQVSGRKLAGVLCEAAPGGAMVVAGVGVNVRRDAALPVDVRATATSVEREAGAPADRVSLAGALLEELRRLLDTPVLRLEGDLAREVAERDVLRGRRVVLDDGRSGTSAGIGPDGALILEREGGRETVVAGSVRLA
ncbi:MAG: biotin--[acetyl-CoA-carboxylase] ligase [Gemmatimonadetes bacterium]|nr:biotin--[acetyl-CoA-carboxylase] ligase [Gemmatimonadota bacterium]